VAVLIGLLGLTRLAALEQRSQDIQGQALVPSMQLAEIRRAFLQTRVDALADELLPKTGAQDTAHQAYLADVDALSAAVRTYSRSGLTAAQEKDLAVLTDSWRDYERLVSGPYLQAAREGRTADFMAMRNGTVGPTSKTLGGALDRLAAAEATDARASVQAATDTYDSARTLILLVQSSAVRPSSATAKRDSASYPEHPTVGQGDDRLEGRPQRTVGEHPEDRRGRPRRLDAARHG
jgi:methyl-accepting chemotaxis protein